MQSIRWHYDRAHSIIKTLYPEEPLSAHTLKKSFGDDTAGNIVAMAKYYLKEVNNSPQSKDKYRLYYADTNKQYDSIKGELSALVG